MSISYDPSHHSPCMEMSRFFPQTGLDQGSQMVVSLLYLDRNQTWWELIQLVNVLQVQGYRKKKKICSLHDAYLHIIFIGQHWLHRVQTVHEELD